MTKEIRLNAFALYSPTHLAPGLWRHPRNRTTEFSTLEYWVELAKLLERGKFDSLFLADSITIHDVYQGKADEAIRRAVQLPKHDPFMLASALAAVTTDLGIALTGSVSYDQPFPVARRFATLDHLSKGRIAWNIVTNTSNSGARAHGRGAVRAHDVRYDVADEFLEAVYKLWEGSWEDDALVADKASGVFARPEKVHKIEHSGEYFAFDGVFIVDPSPQRTPFLFQAGTSSRGRDFAAKHAEGIFVAENDRKALAEIVADIRGRAEKLGRNPRDVKFFSQASPIVGRTKAEAEAKFQDYISYTDEEGALVFLSGGIGTELSKFSPDDPFPRARKDNASHTLTDSVERSRREPTIREIALRNISGEHQAALVGDPVEIADELQNWVDETDIDGFNISYAVSPEGFVDFIDLVVPELQRRGIYKTDYAPGTLREKLGGGARLPASHPAAIWRPAPAP